MNYGEASGQNFDSPIAHHANSSGFGVAVLTPGNEIFHGRLSSEVNWRDWAKRPRWDRKHNLTLGTPKEIKQMVTGINRHRWRERKIIFRLSRLRLSRYWRNHPRRGQQDSHGRGCISQWHPFSDQHSYRQTWRCGLLLSDSPACIWSLISSWRIDERGCDLKLHLGLINLSRSCVLT